jgi:hypothetical protein
MPRFASLGLSLLFCLCAVVRSNAQVTWRAEVEGWTFHAAASNAEKKVIGFLAVADDASINGSNYSVVWLSRDADGGWASYAWIDKDLASALAFVRTAHTDPTFLADHSDLICEPVGSVVSQQALTAGLAEHDPLLDLVLATDEPAQVVEVLASVGHEAAPVLSGMLAVSDTGATTTGEQINMADMLDQMAIDAEYEVFASSTVAVQFICLGCWSTTTVTYSAWTNTYSRPNTAGRLCIYTATRTTTKSYTGERVFGCGACPAPTVTTATVWGYIQLQNESQSCPTYTTTNPPNITEEDPTPQN